MGGLWEGKGYLNYAAATVDTVCVGKWLIGGS